MTNSNLYTYAYTLCTYNILCRANLILVLYVFFFTPTQVDDCQRICEEFVLSVKENMLGMLKKQKVHLLLHLMHSMRDIGPCSAFSAERLCCTMRC